MKDVKIYLKKPIVLLSMIAFLFLTNVFSVCYFFLFKEEKQETENVLAEVAPVEEIEIEKEEEMLEEIPEVKKIVVDIKGYVKNPGVYELDEGAIVNDLIKLAGGVKTNGTTDNINLSKLLKNEDMIVVLSKYEYNKLKNNTTITPNTNVNNSTSGEEKKSIENNETPVLNSGKISINTATKEELMTLSGIGEAKALSIIAYRNEHAFTSIEEIKNVSGIGDALYEQIKNYIVI